MEEVASLFIARRKQIISFQPAQFSKDWQLKNVAPSLAIFVFAIIVSESAEPFIVRNRSAQFVQDDTTQFSTITTSNGKTILKVNQILLPLIFSRS